MSTTMELNETRARFDENMKRAASRCRELSVVMKNTQFNKWADALDGLRLQGLSIANAKSQSKTEIEKDMKFLIESLTPSKLQ